MIDNVIHWVGFLIVVNNIHYIAITNAIVALIANLLAVRPYDWWFHWRHLQIWINISGRFTRQHISQYQRTISIWTLVVEFLIGTIVRVLSEVESIAMTPFMSISEIKSFLTLDNIINIGFPMTMPKELEFNILSQFYVLRFLLSLRFFPQKTILNSFNKFDFMDLNWKLEKFFDFIVFFRFIVELIKLKLRFPSWKKQFFRPIMWKIELADFEK